MSILEYDIQTQTGFRLDLIAAMYNLRRAWGEPDAYLRDKIIKKYKDDLTIGGVGMITWYAVNFKTKAHRVLASRRSDIGMEERRVQADADGWIEWCGGDCPLPDDAVCEMLQRDGAIVTSKNLFSWNHGFGKGDIIAYRPILEQQAEHSEPQAAEDNPWNGEGLPPAGVECEFKLHHKDDKEYEWCYIVGESKDKKWIVFERGNLQTEVHNKQSGVYVFRPIRTDRERWIAAAEAAIEYGTDEPANSAHIGILYDAGLARMPEE